MTVSVDASNASTEADTQDPRRDCCQRVVHVCGLIEPRRGRRRMQLLVPTVSGNCVLQYAPVLDSVNLGRRVA